MRRFVLLNEDGTVNNILYLENVDAILNNDDWKDLSYFDYTDWAPEDHPRTHWTYDFETGTWDTTMNLPTPLPAEQLVELVEPAADELGGN